MQQSVLLLSSHVMLETISFRKVLGLNRQDGQCHSVINVVLAAVRYK
jgi:hypothetical protein